MLSMPLLKHTKTKYSHTELQDSELMEMLLIEYDIELDLLQPSELLKLELLVS
jgi:hypothetical protein